MEAALAEKVAGLVASIRAQPVRKPPSVSESIDWARTLIALGVADPDLDAVQSTLHVLLKYESDIEKVSTELAAAEG